MPKKKFQIAVSLLLAFTALGAGEAATAGTTNMLSGVSQRIDTCSSKPLKLPAPIQVKENGSWVTVAQATHAETGGGEGTYCGGSKAYDSWGLWTPQIAGNFSIRVLVQSTGKSYPSLADGTISLTFGSSKAPSTNQPPKTSIYITVPMFAGSGQNMNAVNQWFRTSGFKGKGYFQTESGYPQSQQMEQMGECHIIRQTPPGGFSITNNSSAILVFYTTC